MENEIETRIQENLRLSPRKELAAYLEYVSSQAGFDFTSDSSLEDKYFRYSITSRFPCIVDKKPTSMKVETRDVLVRAFPGCSSTGENRILKNELTLSIPGGGSIGGQPIISPYVILGLWRKKDLFSGREFFEQAYSDAWYTSQANNPEVRRAIDQLVQANNYVKINFPGLYKLAHAPCYFSLCTYQGDIKQLSEELNEEIRKLNHDKSGGFVSVGLGASSYIMKAVSGLVGLFNLRNRKNVVEGGEKK